jgi:hypothetical protein
VLFEAIAENIMPLLSLRLARVVSEPQVGPIQHIARADNCDILLCMEINTEIVNQLAAWPQVYGVQRLAVYCERPSALQEALEAQGVDANCHSLAEALIKGQAGSRT